MAGKLIAALLGAGLMATVSAHAAVDADKAKTGLGKWRWSESESNYSSGAYAKEQTMTISKNDKSGITVSQNVTLKTGENFEWTISAPYDDKMRHASKWMSVAFSRLNDHQFHDRYVMDADGQKGAETFTITPDRITIKGASIQNGKKMPYVEVWDRVE